MVTRKSTDPLPVRIDKTAGMPTFVYDPDGEFVVTYAADRAPDVEAVRQRILERVGEDYPVLDLFHQLEVAIRAEGGVRGGDDDEDQYG